MKNIKRFAFTLAETLTILAILGVLATIMITNLVNSIQDSIEITQIKKAYSMISNAFSMAIVENGPLKTWNWPEPTARKSIKNTVFLSEKLSEYLPVQRFCGNTTGCFNYGYGSTHKFKTLNDFNGGSELHTDNPNLYTSKMILKNNMRIAFAMGYPDFTNQWDYYHMKIDINGPIGPNRYGYDVFHIFYNSNGLLSFNSYVAKQASFCNKYSIAPSNTTSTPSLDGVSCIYWVIKHNNMNYKRRDISREW